MLLLSSEIFFVDFLPKLLEDIINISFSCRDYNQIAYSKMVNGNLCVAIGLNCAENSLT